MTQHITDKITAEKSAATCDEQTHTKDLARVALGINDEPRVWWECERCAACCRWPGFVRVSEGEIAAIASYVGIGEMEFIQHHTRLRPDRQGLALLDQADGSCIYLEKGECKIQAVKPGQCRGFPNTWNFPGWREICQAKPVPWKESPVHP